MNRSNFVKEFAKRGNITQRDAKELMDIIEDMILEYMQNKEGVKPFNGLKFYVIDIEEGNKRLPNGNFVYVPAHHIPKIEFGTKFKKGVNNKY